MQRMCECSPGGVVVQTFEEEREAPGTVLREGSGTAHRERVGRSERAWTENYW